jgi:hypothetical protein
MKQIFFVFLTAFIIATMSSCSKIEDAENYNDVIVTPPTPNYGPTVMARIMQTNTTIQNGGLYNVPSGLIVFTTNPVETINWTITPGNYYGGASQIAHYFTPGNYTMVLSKPSTGWSVSCTFVVGTVTPTPTPINTAPVKISNLNVVGSNVNLNIAVGWKSICPTFSQTATLSWLRMINGSSWTQNANGLTITSDSVFFTLDFPNVSNSYINWNITFGNNWLIAGNTPVGQSGPSILLTTTAAPNNNYFAFNWVDSVGYPGIKLLKAPNGTTLATWPGGIINPPTATPGLWGDGVNLRGKIDPVTQAITLYFNNVAAGGVITYKMDSLKTNLVNASVNTINTSAVTGYPGWSSVTITAGTPSVITTMRSLWLNYSNYNISPWHETAYSGVIINW